MATDNNDGTGRTHREVGSQSRHGNGYFSTGTRRGQDERVGAYSLPTSYPRFGNNISRVAGAFLEMDLNNPSFNLPTGLGTAQMRNSPNDQAWSPYSMWFQQTTDATISNTVARSYHHSIGVSTIGTMQEPHESRGNQDAAATNGFHPQELQRRYGFLPVAGSTNNAIMPPSPGSESSRWRLESTTSQNSQEHRLRPVVAGARHFSTTNSFLNGYTGNTSETDTPPPSQESCLINWDSRRNGPSVIPPKPKIARKKMTPSEKARIKALKEAGGACNACRKSKKRCSHRDLRLGQNQTLPSSSGSSSSYANNPRRLRQKSDSRTTVVVDEQTGSRRRDNLTSASSSQQLATGGGLSIFTSPPGNNAPPSDATSIEYTTDVQASPRSGDFTLDGAGLGHQFNEPLLNTEGQLDISLYPVGIIDAAVNYPWPSNPSSGHDSSAHT